MIYELSLNKESYLKRKSWREINLRALAVYQALKVLHKYLPIEFS